MPITLTRKLRRLLWLPSQRFYCSISKFRGSAFELLLLKLGYGYHTATLCAEHEWSCWNTKGAPLPNHKGFHKNSDQNISFNFSLLIPGNPVLIKIGATKKWGKEFKKNLSDGYICQGFKFLDLFLEKQVETLTN